jgi:hypothetical protein
MLPAPRTVRLIVATRREKPPGADELARLVETGLRWQNCAGPSEYD